MRAPTPVRVRLRDLRPGEHATVQAVFDGLSPASRQLRFHGPVERLSPRMLEHLSAVDGRDHVAVVAEAGWGRRRRPVGLVRLVRETWPGGTAFRVGLAWELRCPVPSGDLEPADLLPVAAGWAASGSGAGQHRVDLEEGVSVHA